jgi:ATP-dependent helicase/nuclease subunit A
MSESQQRKASLSPVVVEATEKQRAASNPLVSSWVGASAGSGKTKVLTDRILRLLLPRINGELGTKPDKILAITFTKAGANEMALRLSQRLSQWAVLSDEKLVDDMEHNLLGRTPTKAEADEARKLFARVVDTPGGLKIMTIHSFCQSVLGRFPIEAGLPPHFKPLEEGQAKELLERAKKDVLARMETDVLSPLSRAIVNISTVMNETQFGDAIAKLVSERHQMETVLRRTFGIDGFYTALCAQFGIPAGLTEADLFADFAAIDQTPVREACAALATGNAKDQEKGITIQAFWDAEPQARLSLYAAYKEIFIGKSTGELRSKIATNAVFKNAPHVESALFDEGRRILAYEERRKAVFCAALTRDLFLIGQAVLERYRHHKESMGVLDFDDLILKTLSLLKGEAVNLSGEKVAAWVMYKLDEGLDHILVDEAQDTNPEQWEIIRLLAAEFFEGMGAKETVRTIFVVGDEKQSIFSFQRAAPEKFGEMRSWFEKKINDAGRSFVPLDINTSFRSVQVVLDVVDKVYDGNAPLLGLSSNYLNHIAKRQGQSGLVEFWPLYRTTSENDEVEDDQQPSLGGWFMPDKIVETQSGSSQMAAKIGDMIKFWIDSKERLESYDREIRPGDIMILVKSRSAIVGQLVRALKKRNVPVSGVDRMRLTDQIVVQDLCAAAAFALLPEDDLNLAALLKSPFLGVDEDTLFRLAHQRPSSLWNAVRENGDSKVVTWLEKLILRGGSDHPYEFFSRIVQEPCPADSQGGLRALRKRLGEDALDPLDEFLNSTLAYESMHTSGLQGFLKWHTDSSSDIKRELEEAGGAVRIMTVHGSKGLQAPIVFLPDTVHTKPKSEQLIWPHKSGHDVPYFISRKEMAPPQVQAAQSVIEQRSAEEYRRLLYVAMTRAEERLYVGGYSGKKQSSAAHWYDDIRSAFGRLDGVEKIPSGVRDDKGDDMPVLRLSSSRTAKPDKTGKDKPRKHMPAELPLPEWSLRTAPSEPYPPKPLSPSRPSEPEPAAASPLIAGQDYRFQRGNVTHKLMQILPDLPASRRASAAEQYLARISLGLPPQMQKDIAREVLAILDDPAFGDIFGPDSMAEIPVTGFVDGQLISGQIDRVLIREKDILIVDYKTNRPPPLDTKDVPPVYIRQMKAYAETMRKIYPDREVRCALFWTDGARLMPVAV